MSRSGYTDDCEDFADIGRQNFWRANVDRAIRGKRGQSFLREMAAALDAMPVKELVADEIVRDSERVCAIGSVALSRRLDVSQLDVTDGEAVARAFGIARVLACEIAYENDERASYKETPADRWKRMRAWVESQLAQSPEVGAEGGEDGRSRT